MIKRFFHLALFLFFINYAFADVGDTLVIQTINNNTPVLPGWNSPRSGEYVFPPDSISFSKILMVYNLKCDPSQNPACGEWDYTTHTKIYQPTGQIDSTLYFHPNFIVNNQSPDTFMYMDTPSYRYFPRLEYLNTTTPTTTATPGDGSQQISIPALTESIDGKHQFTYTAEELSTAGLQSGDITGLSFGILSGSSEFKQFTVEIGNFSSTLTEGAFINSDMTKVYERNTVLDNGNNNISFAFPYNWEGNSNIIVSLSYSDNTGSVIFSADNENAISNETPDFSLYFKDWDYVNVPKEVFETIDSAITISFWQYGDSDIPLANSSIFEGVDSDDKRVLNVHLPWSSGKIYWDAGYNGYDRIQKTANQEDYKGNWVFWTFIKDCRSGSMQILKNGNFWMNGTGRKTPMINIEKFRIGSAISYDGSYAGMIEDFRIWDTVVSWDLISEWMYKDVDDTHPLYNHLRANYKFNEGTGYEVIDSSPNGFNATLFGYPEWRSYNGNTRYRNAITSNRLNLTFENGNYNPATLDSLVMVDTVENGAVNIVLYNPNSPLEPSDTLTKWPSYYNNYIFNAGGIAIDSTFVTPDDTLFFVNLPYYGEPYEITIPWEIGRFITPYGIGLDLGSDGFTWIYDVTDYRPLLVDTLTVTAGNFQELLDLQFHMIEGTPSREVLKIENLVSGSFSLNNFAELVPPDTIALLPEAESWKVKVRTSGHLFDNPTNCAEFCQKTHKIKVDDVTALQWQILQECSDNPLYPQGGTWIYDRAGWCPGMEVAEQDIEITHLISRDSAIIEYQTMYDAYGNYTAEVHLFSYGSYSFQYDASVEEVIAPNNEKRYGRFNPTGSGPIIVIKNQGSETLTTLDITYGPSDNERTFEWTGELKSQEKEKITLDAFEWQQWQNGDGKFSVQLSNPNGQTDQNNLNDVYYTNYELPEVYPSTFIIEFKTNKAAYQNSYEIKSSDGNTLYFKDNFENQTTYYDTITLQSGCYDFFMYDTGDDGISFWANNSGTGTLKFLDLNGNLLKSFNGDFGDGIYQSFYADIYSGNINNQANNTTFEIIPNPNNGIFNIIWNSSNDNSVEISIYNSQGVIVRKESAKAMNKNISMDISNMPSGLYTVVINNNNNRTTKKFVVK